MDDLESTDFEWPPSDVTKQPGRWYKPGPEFQARAMGIWPTSGSELWSDLLWQACLKEPPPFPMDVLPVLGVDCAQGKSRDYHAIHGRWGDVSVHHETANVMDPERIGHRIKQACAKLIGMVNERRPLNAASLKATAIQVRIDDDGTGGAITAYLRKEGYHIIPVGAGCGALKPSKYRNRRNELWFEVSLRAKMGKVNFSLLDQDTKRRLRQQLMNCEWELNPAGQREVSTKEEMWEKIGRSPDDADSCLLSYAEGMGLEAPTPTGEKTEKRHGQGAFDRLHGGKEQKR